MIGMSEGPLNTNRQRPNHLDNSEPDATVVDATEESNDEILLTEQETNPMHQIGNINVIDIDNLFHIENGGAVGEQANGGGTENE